jgi:predicted MFS family arabinose efflux permease
MASQALLIVLAPTIVAVGADLGASVGAIGQARSVTAVFAISVSVSLAGSVDSIGVPRLLAVGGVVALVACACVAASPTFTVFLAAHVVVGIAFALLLSAGFAGVAAFPAGRRAWAMGYVAGANALAWILLNPAIGVVTDLADWRVAQAVPAAVAVATLLAARTAPRSPSLAAPRLSEVLAVPSARRWVVAELIAYGSWASLLTFVGAFFIEVFEVREAVVGWLLAIGAAAYFLAATRTGFLVGRVRRRRLVAAAALAMALVLPVQFLLTGSVAVAAALFSLAGIAAGIRTPAASSLGLEQLPDSPGAMMAVRTAATQLGYLIGAVVGGALIAGPGYGALGIVLSAGMAASALLIMRVEDPLEERGRARGR